MTDDRRQRYAQEIYAAGPMEINGPETIAEAAMAVADEEQREMRAKLFEWQGSYLDEVKVRQERERENARLRAELEQLRTRIQALTEATVVWRDRPGGDVGLAIALGSILDADKPEPPASATLVRVLVECDRIEREVHGQHDEDDDGMREAIRRIRAAAGTEQVDHVYLSTGCLHGEHGYCQTHTGLSGAKTPAVCKFCKAPCQCPCHAKEQQ